MGRSEVENPTVNYCQRNDAKPRVRFAAIDERAKEYGKSRG